MKQQSLIVHNVMTLEEVANYLKLSKEIIKQLAKNGKIPCRKIEETWRFLRIAVDNWLTGQDNKTDYSELQVNEESLIISNARQLPPLDKIKLLHILAKELDTEEDVYPFEHYKTYALYTPYDTFGAATTLMDAMNSQNETKPNLKKMDKNYVRC